MAEHTKGPWFVTKKFEVGPRSEADDQSNGMVIPIADVFGDNKEANARLFAAAPDLMEALIAAKKHMWIDASSHWTMADFKNWATVQQIDAALDKARNNVKAEATETDKDVLRRIMSEPTFEAVAEAAKRENAQREGKIKEMLAARKAGA